MNLLGMKTLQDALKLESQGVKVGAQTINNNAHSVVAPIKTFHVSWPSELSLITKTIFGDNNNVQAEVKTEERKQRNTLNLNFSSLCLTPHTHTHT